MDRIVGDFGQNAVDWRDQEIDPEHTGDTGEGRRQPGQWMSSQAQKGGGSERDQDQVPGIRGDAGHHADGYQDPGDCLARGHLHDLFDQCGHQTRLLGEADADR